MRDIVNIDFTTEFNKETAHKFIVELEQVFKESIPEDTEVCITIDSPGGVVSELFTMVNMVTFMKSKGFRFTTYNRGTAASCAAVLFSLGDKRITHPSGILIIHQISFGVKGCIDTVEKTVEYARKVNKKVFSILSKNFRYSRKKMIKNCEGVDWVLSAYEAECLGFTEVGVL